MAEVRVLGLTSIKIGAINGDGDMGTSLALLGATFEGTAKFTEADAEITEFFSEESDVAIETIAKKGKATLEWAIVDFDPDTLVKVLGGTSTGTPKVWSAPSTVQTIEKSIEVINSKSGKLEIVRAKIDAKVEMPLSKKDLATVRIIATVLTPTKNGVAPYRITNPS